MKSSVALQRALEDLRVASSGSSSEDECLQERKKSRASKVRRDSDNDSDDGVRAALMHFQMKASRRNLREDPLPPSQQQLQLSARTQPAENCDVVAAPSPLRQPSSSTFELDHLMPSPGGVKPGAPLLPQTPSPQQQRISPKPPPRSMNTTIAKTNTTSQKNKTAAVAVSLKSNATKQGVISQGTTKSIRSLTPRTSATSKIPLQSTSAAHRKMAIGSRSASAHNEGHLVHLEHDEPPCTVHVSTVPLLREEGKLQQQQQPSKQAIALASPAPKIPPAAVPYRSRTQSQQSSCSTIRMTVEESQPPPAMTSHGSSSFFTLQGRTLTPPPTRFYMEDGSLFATPPALSPLASHKGPLAEPMLPLGQHPRSPSNVTDTSEYHFVECGVAPSSATTSSSIHGLRNQASGNKQTASTAATASAAAVSLASTTVRSSKTPVVTPRTLGRGQQPAQKRISPRSPTRDVPHAVPGLHFSHTQQWLSSAGTSPRTSRSAMTPRTSRATQAPRPTPAFLHAQELESAEQERRGEVMGRESAIVAIIFNHARREQKQILNSSIKICEETEHSTRMALWTRYSRECINDVAPIWALIAEGLSSSQKKAMYAMWLQERAEMWLHLCDAVRGSLQLGEVQERSEMTVMEVMHQEDFEWVHCVEGSSRAVLELEDIQRNIHSIRAELEENETRSRCHITMALLLDERRVSAAAELISSNATLQHELIIRLESARRQELQSELQSLHSHFSTLTLRYRKDWLSLYTTWTEEKQKFADEAFVFLCASWTEAARALCACEKRERGALSSEAMLQFLLLQRLHRAMKEQWERLSSARRSTAAEERRARAELYSMHLTTRYQAQLASSLRTEHFPFLQRVYVSMVESVFNTELDRCIRGMLQIAEAELREQIRIEEHSCRQCVAQHSESGFETMFVVSVAQRGREYMFTLERRERKTLERNIRGRLAALTHMLARPTEVECLNEDADQEDHPSISWSSVPSRQEELNHGPVQQEQSEVVTTSPVEPSGEEEEEEEQPLVANRLSVATTNADCGPIKEDVLSSIQCPTTTTKTEAAEEDNQRLCATGEVQEESVGPTITATIATTATAMTHADPETATSNTAMPTVNRAIKKILDREKRERQRVVEFRLFSLQQLKAQCATEALKKLLTSNNGPGSPRRYEFSSPGGEDAMSRVGESTMRLRSASSDDDEDDEDASDASTAVLDESEFAIVLS